MALHLCVGAGGRACENAYTKNNIGKNREDKWTKAIGKQNNIKTNITTKTRNTKLKVITKTHIKNKIHKETNILLVRYLFDNILGFCNIVRVRAA